MYYPIYSILYTGAILSIGPYLLMRGRKSGKYAWNMTSRLGFGLAPLPPKSNPRVWVHALSLGEVQSSVELIQRLSQEGCELCCSTTTRTGYEAARRRLPEIPLFSMPLDLPSSVKRTVDAIRPDLLVIIETDIWPNLLAGLSAHSIPAVLINARLSPRSFRGYSLISGFWGRVLNTFSIIACQTQVDKDRFLALGALESRVLVTGNLKFDRPWPETGPEIRQNLLWETGLPDGLWIVAGSTHHGEEEALLNIYASLRTRFPHLRLLIAPRDQERNSAVWRLINQRFLSVNRRTDGRPHPDCQIFLLDTLGELDRFYELADLVFIGKTLPGAGEGGGQNLLEPASRSKPVLFGPRMHNFSQAAQLMVEARGGRPDRDVTELEAAMAELLTDTPGRQELGRRAA
ncbi:MAG: 3-deoxy-D-manno-octulosonic acid transferase, partial [Deltaproteobacteria bacterium]|nr:3-deoxy-D-manno-octulosonic acid transferase [Deltaproteobacteria bacterium]